MEGLLGIGYVAIVAVLAKFGHRLKRPNVPVVPAAKATEGPRRESLKLTRFSRIRPTELEAIAELLWFGDEKHKRGEMIFWDELPTIRNTKGVDCVVIVRTIHFLPFLAEHKELRRRNAIVLEIPLPNA